MNTRSKQRNRFPTWLLLCAVPALPAHANAPVERNRTESSEISTRSATPALSAAYCATHPELFKVADTSTAGRRAEAVTPLSQGVEGPQSGFTIAGPCVRFVSSLYNGVLLTDGSLLLPSGTPIDRLVAARSSMGQTKQSYSTTVPAGVSEAGRFDKAVEIGAGVYVGQWNDRHGSILVLYGCGSEGRCHPLKRLIMSRAKISDFSFRPSPDGGPVGALAFSFSPSPNKYSVLSYSAPQR